MKFELNPNHISGIHNYCDRWCERCSFTAKCSVYSMESDNSPEQNDINNKLFWDNIAANMQAGIKMMQEKMEELGIKIEPLTKKEKIDYSKKQEKIRGALEKTELIISCKKYTKLVSNFLEENDLLKLKGETLLTHAELGLVKPNEAIKQIELIKDCIEVIQWYIYFAHVKFMRALPTEEDDGDKFFYDDSNGSAKVALISIDRCLNAWQNILLHFPEFEDDIINILALLQKIKKNGEITFPLARAYKRVGLDEEP